jgi:hypothetical protein
MSVLIKTLQARDISGAYQLNEHPLSNQKERTKQRM